MCNSKLIVIKYHHVLKGGDPITIRFYQSIPIQASLRQILQYFFMYNLKGNTLVSYDDAIKYKVRVEVIKISKIVPLFDISSSKVTNVRSSSDYSRFYTFEFEFFSQDEANNVIKIKRLRDSELIDNNL